MRKNCITLTRVGQVVSTHVATVRGVRTACRRYVTRPRYDDYMATYTASAHAPPTYLDWPILLRMANEWKGTSDFLIEYRARQLEWMITHPKI